MITVWRGRASLLARHAALLEGWRRQPRARSEAHPPKPSARCLQSGRRRIACHGALLAAPLGFFLVAPAALAADSAAVQGLAVPASPTPVIPVCGIGRSLHPVRSRLHDRAADAGQPPWRHVRLAHLDGPLRHHAQHRGDERGAGATSPAAPNAASSYEGLTTMTLQLDTSKALPSRGRAVQRQRAAVPRPQSQRRGLAQPADGERDRASNRASRLWELWYQQAFFEGRVDVKVGQQSIDQEFMVSARVPRLFVNTMMGWPMLPSADLLRAARPTRSPRSASAGARQPAAI